MSSLKVVRSSFRVLALGLPLTLACCGTTVVFDDGAAGSGSGASGTGATGSGAGAPNGGAGAGTSGVGGSSPGCDCDAYFPVCGVDGNTHNAGCGDHCVGVDIACEGSCPCQSCDEIASEYRALLEQARSCDAVLDVEQCTLKVTDALICGCPTFVNPSNRSVIDEMWELEDKFYQLNCEPLVQCEACAPDPVGGTCSSDTNRVDTCVDRWN